MTVNVPLHDIKFIDFSGIFKQHVETELINQLGEFNLIKDDQINIRNKHVKRLLYHHTIKGLCDYVLSAKGKSKIIIVYSTTTLSSSQLNLYIDRTEMQTFFDRFIMRVIKMLPIKFLYTDTTFNVIRSNIRKNNGDSADIINSAKRIISDFDTSKYTFTKARYFAKRYGLLYLSNNFFHQIKNKQLIIR